MQKKSILNTPRLIELKKRKRKVICNRIIFFAVCFLILFTMLAFLSHWKKININNVYIQGNKVVEKEQIENVVNKIINQKYLWIFPKRNSFIYPTGQIKKTLATELKRLKNITVNVDANDLQTLNIKVGEYDGKYLYCGNAIPEILTIQQCYFLDSDGYIFDEAPYFSGEVYFKFYGNLNSDNIIGSYFSKENFKNIITFKESIEKMNLKPIVFYTEDNEEGNIYLSSTAKMPNAPKIIFKLNADYTKLVENLQSAITTDPLKTKVNQNLGSLSYIDLRYGNKVYFK